MRPSCLPLISCLALTALPAQAFDAADLQGSWAESNHGHYACAPASQHQRFELSADGKGLTITIEGRLKAHEKEVLKLQVTRSNEHSLFVRFVGHGDASDPLAGEWAISMLGPGVYRWHLASEHEGGRPAPLGIRCGP